MANEQNLIPVTKRTPREQKVISSKGGKASAKVKQERKLFKEALLIALETKKGNKTIQELGIVSLMKKFMAGDLEVFKTVRDSIGEKPIENMNLNSNNVVYDVSKMSNKQIDDLLKKADEQ